MGIEMILIPFCMAIPLGIFILLAILKDIKVNKIKYEELINSDIIINKNILTEQQKNEIEKQIAHKYKKMKEDIFTPVHKLLIMHSLKDYSIIKLKIIFKRSFSSGIYLDSFEYNKNKEYGIPILDYDLYKKIDTTDPKERIYVVIHKKGEIVNVFKTGYLILDITDMLEKKY